MKLPYVIFTSKSDAKFRKHNATSRPGARRHVTFLQKIERDKVVPVRGSDIFSSRRCYTVIPRQAERSVARVDNLAGAKDRIVLAFRQCSRCIVRIVQHNDDFERNVELLRVENGFLKGSKRAFQVTRFIVQIQDDRDVAASSRT